METNNWYERSKQYWSTQNSEQGVIGCIENINDVDLQFTDTVLTKLKERSILEIPNSSCIDLGAGVGRVSKHVLSKHFSKLTLVEQCQNMCSQNTETFSKDQFPDHDITIVNQSLQEFKHRGKQDLVMCDWILSHLQDDDQINFLDVIKLNMHKHSTMLVKDNVNNTSMDDEIDEADFSVTRPANKQELLFRACGFQIMHKEQQPQWPSDLQPVQIWALKEGNDEDQQESGGEESGGEEEGEGV